MTLRIHAICLALNEECFIQETLKPLYPFCSGISILTQYDRDWYGKHVQPDSTTIQVLNYPDPEGKIHLVVRRWRDQAPALNSEMLALSSQPARWIQSHGTPIEEIRKFHETPDYFLIVDADEIYDINTFESVLHYLARKKPRGMRMTGYNYVRTWNRRVPAKIIHFNQFGFVQPGVLFKFVRVVSWNETRLAKLLRMAHLPDFSARVFGFIDCPEEVGVFHHGCWLGNNARLIAKTIKSAHKKEWNPSYPDHIDSITTDFIPTHELPINIQQGSWPLSFWESE